MNKVCLTQRGLQFINQEKNEYEQRARPDAVGLRTQGARSNSLPQLISIVPPHQKQQISAQISQLTLQLTRLQDKGLKRMMLDKQDQNVTEMIEREFSQKRSYLRSIVPALVKKTRNSGQLGSLQSRMERSRAYLSSLQQKFEGKFVFRAPQRASMFQKQL